MAQLMTSRQARITAEIADLEALKTSYKTMLLTASASDAKEYRVDSGEGSQRKEAKNDAEIREIIRKISGEIEWLYAKLEGRGLGNMNLRRNI
jgi:hypothetical protein